MVVRRRLTQPRHIPSPKEANSAEHGGAVGEVIHAPGQGLPSTQNVEDEARDERPVLGAGEPRALAPVF